MPELLDGPVTSKPIVANIFPLGWTAYAFPHPVAYTGRQPAYTGVSLMFTPGRWPQTTKWHMLSP